MADRLTQLQDCMEDFILQMFATLNYIRTHHPYGEIPGQPSQAPQIDNDRKEGSDPTTKPTNGAGQPDTAQVTRTEADTPAADAPASFQAALRELAQDLIMQEQKAEILINSLPGIGNSERDQTRRMEELGLELKQVEHERLQAEEEKTALLKRLDELVFGLHRGA